MGLSIRYGGAFWPERIQNPAGPPRLFSRAIKRLLYHGQTLKILL